MQGKNYSVKEKHKIVDAKLKTLAKEYKKSARAIKTKILELENTVQALPIKTPQSERIAYTNDLKLLNQMYRTTCEIGREAEHYYERGWWRSEIYTLNSR